MTRSKTPTLRFDFSPEHLLGSGPIIETDIGVTDTFAKALLNEGKSVPNKVRCRLLLDTGADLCLIRHDIALKAGLKLISAESPIHGIGVDTTGRSYLGRVWIGNQTKHEIWIDTEIVGATLPYEHVDGLMGRDVLQYFDLRYNGQTGRVTMDYLRPKEKR